MAAFDAPAPRQDALSTATPRNSVLLAYASVAPIPISGIAAVMLPAGWRDTVTHMAIVWSGAVLCFLAGVRRGDSFHTPDGPTALQLTGVFTTFAFALASLLLPGFTLCIAAAATGFITVALLDPLAARHDQAPRFFARIRPPQMAVAITGLALLLAAQFR